MKSDLTLERRILGELPFPAGAEDAPEAAELRSATEDFLRRRPVGPFTAALEGRRKSRGVARRSRIAAGLAACLVFAIAVPALYRNEDATRVKGADVGMQIYHKTATGSESLGKDAVLQAGDEIRIAYTSKSELYAVILSVDGRGKITPHMPAQGRDAKKVRSEKPTALPYAYRLDDAPSYEDLYFIVSSEPFTFDLVIPFFAGAAAGYEAEPLLPEPFKYSYFRINKQETR